ncbi:MAG TPA: RimK family protein [Fibrobacteraceae bacterium]|nr:RimK family protein [Fibrobacteraceae bacterium]
MKKIIVVNNTKHWNLRVSGVDVVSAKDYLTNPAFTDLRNVRVFNLCREYTYQSKGYYVSLLAEARGHKVIPNVKNIQDLKAPAIIKIISDELDELIQRTLRRITSQEYVLSIYFGQNVSRLYSELSEELHRLFQAPFVRVKFVFKGKWFIQSLKTISLDEIPEAHLPMVNEFAKAYFDKTRYAPARSDKYLYDLAILVNPDEKSPPSDKRAIQKFIEAAKDVGFSTELITRKDYHRIAEFDALFIRETTGVNHHTYRFARRAQSEGLVVIDDPDSILRCSNKVYLQELMSVGRVPSPRTMIVHSENRHTVATILGLPCVLKLPDSSFSQGVVKVTTREEMQAKLDKMFDESDLVIAQEFTPTDFDWRIGVLDGSPLFACKYFMAKGHWQIYNWNSNNKKEIAGNYECLPLEAVPKKVVATALKVTSLIGRGLYGVDLKEIHGRPVVIEVNDNPNIDSDVEDKVYGKEVYLNLMWLIRRRIEARLSSLKNPLRPSMGVPEAK